MLMAEHPDSSLALLEAVNPSELRSESSRALYGLLLTQAQFKNYAPPQDDSLITVVADYYEGAGRDDSPHRMLANYYYGRTRLNEKDYAKSLFAFFNAYELATAEADPFWAAMAAERICEIYRETYNYKEMQKFAEIELQNFRKFGNPLYIHDGLLDMAMAYHCNEKYDSAIQLCRELADTAHKYKDCTLGDDAAHLMALSFFGKAQYDSASIHYETLLKSTTALASDSAYLGLCLFNLGNPQRAAEFIPELSSVNNVDSWLRYKIFLFLNDRDNALSMLQTLMADGDTMLKDQIKYNLSGSLIDYHNYKANIENERNRFTKVILLLIITISILFLIIVIIFSYLYIKKQRFLIERNVSLANNLSEMLTVQTDYKNSAVLELLSQRFKVLDSFCQTMYEGGSTPQAKRKVSKEVDKLIKQFSDDKDKIKELEDYADKHYDGVMTKFHSDFPNLIKNDYLLFLYSLYGFSSSAIALFLDLDNVSGVYDRRKRLKNKIKEFKGENKKIFYDVLDKRL